MVNNIDVGDHFFIEDSGGHPVFRCVAVEVSAGSVIISGLACGDWGPRSFYADYCIKCD